MARIQIACFSRLPPSMLNVNITDIATRLRNTLKNRACYLRLSENVDRPVDIGLICLLPD